MVAEFFLNVECLYQHINWKRCNILRADTRPWSVNHFFVSILEMFSNSKLGANDDDVNSKALMKEGGIHCIAYDRRLEARRSLAASKSEVNSRIDLGALISPGLK